MNVGEGATGCFWLEPTGMVRLSIRRFTHGLATHDGVWEVENRTHRACSAVEVHTYDSGEQYRTGCDASVDLGIEIPIRIKTDDDGWQFLDSVPRSKRIKTIDHRWPTVCAKCGQSFKQGHHRQWNQEEVYTRGDTGERVAFRGYGHRKLAGALYDAWWLHSRVTTKNGVERRYVGPDGIALVAVCPNGAAWEVDGPSSNGNGWTRTGDPRNPPSLTVSPSIIAGDYHGFLQAGAFTAHIG